MAMRNDDEELGDQFLLDDDSDDEPAKDDKMTKKRKSEEQAKSVLKKPKKKKLAAIWTLNPREWTPEQWTEWLRALRPETKVDLAKHVEQVDRTQLAHASKGLQTIVVCGSAIRSAQVAKLLQPTKVAKLFGKHLKLDDQLAVLRQKKVPPIAVGTPTRLEALSGALGPWPVAPRVLIVIDSDPDLKQYNPLTLPDAKYPLARFIDSFLHHHSDLRLAALSFNSS